MLSREAIARNLAAMRASASEPSSSGPSASSPSASHSPDPTGGGAAPTASASLVERSAALALRARHLDTRLRGVTHLDRQVTRRAAAHVAQLARRLSGFLSRHGQLLPVLPATQQSRRLRHHVLHAQRLDAGNRVYASTQLLTIGTNGMLRVGQTSGDGAPIVWREYDPFDPAPNWPLEQVLAHLADALSTVESHIASVEQRSRERTRALDALIQASTPARGGRRDEPETAMLPAPIALPLPLPVEPSDADDLFPTAREIADADADADADTPANAAPASVIVPAPVSGAAPRAAVRAPVKRQLFDRLR